MLQNQFYAIQLTAELTKLLGNIDFFKRFINHLIDIGINVDIVLDPVFDIVEESNNDIGVAEGMCNHNRIHRSTVNVSLLIGHIDIAVLVNVLADLFTQRGQAKGIVILFEVVIHKLIDIHDHVIVFLIQFEQILSLRTKGRSQRILTEIIEVKVVICGLVILCGFQYNTVQCGIKFKRSLVRHTVNA